MNSQSLKFSLFLVLIFSLHSLGSAQEDGSIKGTLYDQNGEPAVFAKVILENKNIGVLTDIDGNFHIKAVPVGTYNLIITSIEHQPKVVKDVVVRADKTTIIDDSLLIIENEVMDLKPIIYIYPEDTIAVNVKLNYKGRFTTTYPKYTETGWNVAATPESVLIDSTGRSYYSLYWEGIPNTPLTITKGTVVAKENTIEFLEDKLSILGLSDREANEFIIFWLPILEGNPFNLISFNFEEYDNNAQLIIEPKPDTIIRVMMVFQRLNTPIEIEPQELEAMSKKRTGFTVVEWGGQESIPETSNHANATGNK